MTQKLSLRGADLTEAARLVGRVTPSEIVHNSGRVYTYIPGINPYWDSKGWVSTEMPGFDPAGADICVHDLLEHFPGDPASVAGEYMAQGAAVYIRVQPGYFGSREEINAWVDSAFGTLFASILARHHLTEEPPPSGPSCGEATGHMTDMLDHAHTVTAFEQIEIWAKQRRSPGTRQQALDALRTSLDAALPWMQEGYRRAAARYEGCGKGERVMKIFRCAVTQVAAIEWDPDTKFKLALAYQDAPGEITCSILRP